MAFQSHVHSSSKHADDKATQGGQSIPQPPTHWIIGNAGEIDPKFPISSIWRLADLYGPIYKLNIVGNEFLVLSSFELVNEVCDDDRFEKYVGGALEKVRMLAGDGLFTAYSGEPNWWKAHRILVAVFGPLNIRKMFPEMLDIGSQLILKWDRLGPDHAIDVADDFTRLAFDTIGLCAFSFRFNNFYLEHAHPFIKQMGETLIEAGNQTRRTWLQAQLHFWSNQHTQENIDAMWELCDKLVAERKAHPQPDNHDLLNTMLTTADPETGEKLSDENIRFNMVTFLIAGHETTSGTLSFLMYHFCKNPEKFLKAQAEIDKVVGDSALELKHVPQLKYIDACIKETLRYMGPIGLFTRHAKENTVIGEKYHVSSKTPLQVNLRGLHHDTKVWGNDVDVFKPDRFLDGGYEALPPNAFRPFGFGMRSCIGRSFAEQEMVMIVALILQRFQIEAADPTYDLRIKSTLTIKPQDFKMKVRRRPGKSYMVGLPGAPSSTQALMKTPEHASMDASKAKGDKPKLLILYGSNAGTCKALAEDLESAAGNRAGYNSTVETMDRATEHLPTDGTPVIIVTPSYEGKPADNAKKFVTWLEMSASQNMNSLKGMKYAVFGAGNSEWVRTFHRIPKLVDELCEKLGGTRLCPAGYVDVKEDIIGPWEDFTADLWPVLAKATGTKEQLKEEEIKVQFEKAEHAKALAGEEIDYGYVRKNDLIATDEVGPAKKHMEVELPADVTYRTGDYLVVLPINPSGEIKRLCLKFKLHIDDAVSISGTSKSFLSGKDGAPITVAELLGTRVELGTPVSQRQLETIAKTASDANERKAIEELASDRKYKEEVLAKRMSIIDILDDYPSCKLDFAAYLDMLKPLSPRQYSISSSPLAKKVEPGSDETPTMASVTYDVHERPARSGHNRIFRGVASTYLSNKDVGGKLRCFVRPTNAAFHLPQDTETPVIMIAAGTGFAPMRGFTQERACLTEAGGKKLGPAILYFGCRDADKDFIYKDELKKWEEAGVVEVRPTFSRNGPEGHYKYVPDRIWAERDELAQLFKDGAKIFLCGSASKLAKSSNEIIMKIWLEKNPGKTEDDAFEWLQKQREERYVSDVFD